ncbi:Ribosomal RNA processing protein 1 B [Podochytrium sp. JEL0797]|nr:Ribosomal RNA processing protein 1 B [Podochytrium sp. JEL0797]
MTAAQGGGFGKNLAHTEKSIRDKAVHALSEWLVNADNLDLTNMTKLWKGLFYCYWMSDKPVIQHELAERLALLILDLDNEKALLYIQAFWRIIILEWPGLDRLRLDKFYNLLRNFHRHSFMLLEKNKFDHELVSKYIAILEDGPISANNVRIPDSLKFHTAEAYLDEMNNGFSGEECKLPSEIGVLLLSPFTKAFATSNNAVYVGKIEVLFGKVVDILDNNVRYEDEPEKKEFQVPFDNTRICQELYKLIDEESTLFRNRKALNAVISRFFKEGGVKVEDVKGAQAPVVRKGLKPLSSAKPIEAAPEPEAMEEDEPLEEVAEIVVAPAKPHVVKKSSIPVFKAAVKEAAAKPTATVVSAPEIVTPTKNKKKGLKRSTPDADSAAMQVEAKMTPSPKAVDSPPKKMKLTHVTENISLMKPANVAVATRINTEKNAKHIKIKATAAEIEELKKKALEARKSKKDGSVTSSPPSASKKPKRNIQLKMENNTTKMFDKLQPIGMIPIEIPPFSPSKPALKIRK